MCLQKWQRSPELFEFGVSRSWHCAWHVTTAVSHLVFELQAFRVSSIAPEQHSYKPVKDMPQSWLSSSQETRVHMSWGQSSFALHGLSCRERCELWRRLC